MRLNREVGKLLKGITLPCPGVECNDLVKDESPAWGMLELVLMYTDSWGLNYARDQS